MMNSFPYEWESIGIVGKGGSSTVYQARIKAKGTYIAVKQIETDGLSKDQINGIKGEIETMKSLSHPNILSYLGTEQNPNRVMIFLEYADKGSIRQYYQKFGPLSEIKISYCLEGIISGLCYLHSNGIAHRDIKCANCLIGDNEVVKLADFGASKRFESDSIVSGLKGTPHWMAPEVIKGTQMTTGWIKSDVWSLGCTVVEMFTAKVPYAEYENPMTAMYKIATGELPSLKSSFLHSNSCPSSALLSFINTCCAVDPSVRPNVSDLQNNIFIEQTKVTNNSCTLFPDDCTLPHMEEVTVKVVEQNFNEQLPVISEKVSRNRAESNSSQQSIGDEITVANITVMPNYFENDFTIDDFPLSEDNSHISNKPPYSNDCIIINAIVEEKLHIQEPNHLQRFRIAPLSSGNKGHSRSNSKDTNTTITNTNNSFINGIITEEDVNSLEDVSTPSIYRNDKAVVSNLSFIDKNEINKSSKQFIARQWSISASSVDDDLDGNNMESQEDVSSSSDNIIPSFDKAEKMYKEMKSKYSPRHQLIVSEEINNLPKYEVNLDNVVIDNPAIIPVENSNIVCNDNTINTTNNNNSIDITSFENIKQNLDHSTNESAVYSNLEVTKKNKEQQNHNNKIILNKPTQPNKYRVSSELNSTILLNTNHNAVINLNSESSLRPYAPLSGEKLRLHNVNKKTLVAGSSDLLNELSQTGAAAIRKIANQEILILPDKIENVQKSKSSVNTKNKSIIIHHHVAKTSKRSRNIRSQSAGLYEGTGQVSIINQTTRKDNSRLHRLPPVTTGVSNGLSDQDSSKGIISHVPDISTRSRFIQTAPAHVSHSLALPPINENRKSASSLGSNSLNFTSGTNILLTSQTPNSKQLSQINRFNDRSGSDNSSILQQSFANALKSYSNADSNLEQKNINNKSKFS